MRAKQSVMVLLSFALILQIGTAAALANDEITIGTVSFSLGMIFLALAMWIIRYFLKD